MKQVFSDKIQSIASYRITHALRFLTNDTHPL